MIILDEYWNDEDHNMSGYDSFMFTEDKIEWLVWEFDKTRIFHRNTYNPTLLVDMYWDNVEKCLLPKPIGV